MGKKETRKAQLLKAAKRRAQRQLRSQEPNAGDVPGAPLRDVSNTPATAAATELSRDPMTDAVEDQRATRARMITGSSANDAPDRDSSTSRLISDMVDRLVQLLLDFDAVHDGLTDRHVITALRGTLRGYPSSDLIVRELYQSIQLTKSECEMTGHSFRRSVEQLIETIQSCGDGTNSTRAALLYLRSLAN